ncbi:hypothetical protein LIER_29808 [Lithospermum erythrorhizon]|uniref:Uncharacterized protein n=1 Tax=Lithospermum erythrorhizon TaxID=34254 RepID=A0AAV3RNB7_LITER
MAYFFTLSGDSGTTLHISTRDSKDTTILSVYASLYKGVSIASDSILDSEVGGRMDWSLYFSGASWDGPIEIPGTFGYTPGYWEWAEDVLSRCSYILSAAHLEKAVQAPLYVYDCSDAMAKDFCAMSKLVDPYMAKYGGYTRVNPVIT